MKLLENAIILIYIVQFVIIGLVVITALYYEWNFRKWNRVEKHIKKVLLTVLEQDVPCPEFPVKWTKVKRLIPVLEELDSKFNGIKWKQIKEILIHERLHKELQTIGKKKGWTSIGWFLRALKLSPKQKYELVLIRGLKHQNVFVKMLAIEAAMSLKTEPAVLALLEEFANARDQFRFPYLDAFLEADDMVWQILYRLYQKHPPLRPAALQILGRKTGYLKLKEIAEHMNSSDSEEVFWAMKALQNTPSDESIALLMQRTEATNVSHRFGATYLLGKMRVQAPERFEELLNDEEASVRLAAGWALSHHNLPINNPSVASYLEAFSPDQIEGSLSKQFFNPTSH